MTDDEPRRSRTAWPGPMSIAGVGEGHTHELPRPLRSRVRLLTRAVVIFGVCLLVIGTCLVLILVDRGRARDEESARTNRQINEQFCALLGLAPADSPQADYYREQLGCPQPGVATDQLPPEIRQRYAPTPVPVTPAAPSSIVPPPPLGSAAVPGVERPTPNSPPPAEPASPTPLVDPGPITDHACDLAGVCI